MASYSEGDLRKALTDSGVGCWAIGYATQRLAASKLLTDDVRECLRAVSWALAATEGPGDEVALKAQEMVLSDMVANVDRECDDCDDLREAVSKVLEKRVLLLGDFGREQ